MASKKQEKVHTHHSHEEAALRLRRAKGHLDSVVKMLESERPCVEILQQLSAVIAALGGARTMLFKDHLRSCLKPALKSGHESLVDEMELIITRAMKN